MGHGRDRYWLGLRFGHVYKRSPTRSGFWVLEARFQSYTLMIGDSYVLALGGRSKGTDPVTIYEFMNIILHGHLHLRPFCGLGRLRVICIPEHS